MPFVVLYKGLDNNDEYHSIGGDNASVEKNGFKTIEKAREYAKKQLRNDMKNFQFHSFSEGAEDAQEAMDLWGEWKELDPKVTITNYNGREYRYTNWDWDVLETDWIEFINEAELRGVEWVNLVPNLYEIIEVNFDD